MKRRRDHARSGRHGGAAPHADEGLPDSARQDRPPWTKHAGDAFPRLSDLAFDAQEALTISLMRFVMAGYCSGRTDAWDHGCAVAEEAHGPEGGVIFFTRILALGRALKAERVGAFHVMPGPCGCMCEDEVALLAAVQAARRPDPTLLALALFALSRRPDAPRLHAALRGLGGLLDAISRNIAPNDQIRHGRPDRPSSRLH
jgi:hypothetical protein